MTHRLNHLQLKYPAHRRPPEFDALNSSATNRELMTWGTCADSVTLLERLPKTAYVQLFEPLQMVAGWVGCRAELAHGQRGCLRSYSAWLNVFGLMQ